MEEEIVKTPYCSDRTGALIPTFKGGVRLKEEPQGAVIIDDADDDASGEYLLVSPFEAFILALFDGARSIQDIARILMTLKDGPDEETVQQDVCTFARRYDDFIELASVPRFTRKATVDPRTFITKPDIGSRPTRPQKPLAVDLYVTRDCNLRCTYCFAGAKYVLEHRDCEDFSGRRSRIFNLVDQIADFDLRRILVTGGEPTLLPYLPEVIGRLTTYGIRVTLATNALLMSDKLVESLKGAGLQKVQAKLDAGRPSIQDALSGVEGSYAKLIEGIRILKRHSLYVSVASVVTASNIQAVPEVIRICADLGVDEVSPRLYAAGIWALEGRGGAHLNPPSSSLARLQQVIAEPSGQVPGRYENFRIRFVAVRKEAGKRGTEMRRPRFLLHYP